jgi:hypothetical protein
MGKQLEDFNNLYQVFDGQEGSYFIEKYKKAFEKTKFSTEDIVELVNKLDEVVNICNQIGQQLKYKFHSYTPGFVSANPFFFYFNEEEDLKKFLYNRYPKEIRGDYYKYAEKIQIEWNSKNINGDVVFSKENDGKIYVQGFIKEVK